MTDYYQDQSSVTRPPLMSSRVHYGNVLDELDKNFIFSDVRANDTGRSKLGWMAIYADGKSTLVIKKQKSIPAYNYSSDSSGSLKKIAALKEAVEYVYCNDEASILDPANSRVALRGVIDSVEDLVDSGDYFALDALLSMVEPQRLRPITAVAFLRSSFAVKERLLRWNGLYQVVYAHLYSIKQDPARALRGLSGPAMDVFA
ncbi:hypothetical protein [Pseudomonas congelans]|uniref:hypothetical protein n=1 Tax=Pseudomonas congelans TaxID=200452 RepID=UPI00117A740B|nr:hypothetical protein [Pseudomonas congelans]